MIDLLFHQTYYGFTLTKKESIDDIHSTVYELFHEQSGARLLYLQNNDNNKVFNVAFKTPPNDDCGTPHILEHSVLCGSRKYEAKDPFNELAKGSLNTFLNAMTYADKTMYPVASCNEKDFHNLMDVYLDAVFYPKIYQKKEIFLQEGWRYLLQENDLDITGVVYNEMKGALSDPESQLGSVISKAIFGNTTYGFESGGDPRCIPNLTYEDFIAFHKKYYHPSNAYFYLYGDLNILECLKHIHEGYLSTFDKTDDIPIIEETEINNKGKIIYDTYAVSDHDSESGTYLTCSYKVGKCTDPELVMALQILSYLLLENNASPLKNALINEGTCEETEGWFDSSTYEMVFTIVAKNADEKRLNDFQQTMNNVFEQILTEGFSSDLIESALRKYEFLLREEDYGSTPKGLIYCSRMMKQWLHGEDPCNGLIMIQTIEKIKEKSTAGYFENLLKNAFVHNTEKVYIVFSPDTKKAENEEQSFREAMMKRFLALKKDDKVIIQKETADLEIFQKQEDPKNVLEQIPLLSIDEIDQMPALTKYTVHTLENGNDLLHIPLESNGIIYMKLFFDVTAVPQDLLPYTGLLTEILGKLDTEKYDYQQLPTLKNSIFGGISFQNTTFHIDAEHFRAFLSVKMKFMKENIEDAFHTLQEILLHTKYEQLDNLKKIIKSAKIKGEYELQNNAHYYAIFHSAGNLFPAMKIDELTSGIEYYHFLCEIEKQLENNADDIITKLRKTADLIFNKENMDVSIGCESEDFHRIEKGLHSFHMPERHYPHNHYYFELYPQKTAFTTPAGIVYNVTSFDYKSSNVAYHGKYMVLRTIINLEYLWNQVRVQGGAYGCGCKFTQSGFSYLYSYRDPNLNETYNIYKNLAEKIGYFQADEREMTKYILGTINELDQPKTNMDKLNAAISKHYKVITDKDLINQRHQILQTTTEDIRSCKNLLQLIDCNNICTIGNEKKIRSESKLFDHIKPLI